MLTILTLAKIITDTDTNTAFEKYCQYQYFCDITFNCFHIQQHSFFLQLSINEVNKMIVVEKMAKSQ